MYTKEQNIVHGNIAFENSFFERMSLLNMYRKRWLKTGKSQRIAR